MRSRRCCRAAAACCSRLRRRAARTHSQVAVLDLKTGQRKTLIRGGSEARRTSRPRQATSGYLVYAAAGTLRAVRFDPVRLEVLGDPVTVVEHGDDEAERRCQLCRVADRARSSTCRAGPVEQEPPRSLVWVDRKGREEPIGAPLRVLRHPRLSPDGTRVAVGILDQNADIWIWDFARETLQAPDLRSRASTDCRIWTPDGRRIIFMSNRAGAPNLYAQAADGTGTVIRLTTSAHAQWPTSITPDGTRLVGFEIAPGTAATSSCFRCSPAARRGAPLADGAACPDACSTKASPRSRPMVGTSPTIRTSRGGPRFTCDRSRRCDSGRWQISTEGGTRPVWARSGRELFYIDESNALTGVAVRTSGPTFSAGSPAKIFDTTYAEPNPTRHYDVSPDGQRFLMIKDSAAGDPNATPASMVVVLNWFEELKQRVPANGK